MRRPDVALDVVERMMRRTIDDMKEHFTQMIFPHKRGRMIDNCRARRKRQKDGPAAKK